MGVEFNSPKADGGAEPVGYKEVLGDLTTRIATSRREAAAVNWELDLRYWHIGSVIVKQQKTANWGDSVVNQLAVDLRMAFPKIKGLSRVNVFQMRQLVRSCHEVDAWLARLENAQDVDTKQVTAGVEKVVTVSRLFKYGPRWHREKLSRRCLDN